ncbi:MAG: hypothetical protein AB7O38_28225, partial [Pirellulaceae bacterium]
MLLVRIPPFALAVLLCASLWRAGLAQELGTADGGVVESWGWLPPPQPPIPGPGWFSDDPRQPPPEGLVGDPTGWAPATPFA